MSPLPRIAACLLQLQALEEPELLWLEGIDLDHQRKIHQAAQLLAEKAAQLLSEWAKSGAVAESDLLRLEDETCILLGGLDDMPCNHQAQRNINIAKSILRINS